MQPKAIILALLLSISTLFAQEPIPLGSIQQIAWARTHITDSITHLSVQPFYRPINDTFYIKPAIATFALIQQNDINGLATGGFQAAWKQKKFFAWSNCLFGIGLPPSTWPYPTMPFVGKTLQVSNINLITDLRFRASYKTKYIRFEAGRAKFHLGQGYRSVWLDNYAPAFPYIGANVKVWKVLYGYRISYIQNPDFRFEQRNFFHAYNITHYFDFSFGRLNINMFETVMQDPIDSLGARRGFDFFNYINPVIFYRAVDLSLGSPDNILLGLGGSLRLFKTTVIYSYGILDEMIVSHLLAGDKCWCLKYGANAGVKTYNLLGLNGVFAQLEANFVRPYTYSHDNPILAYGNLYQPLAHPLGANFYEALGRVIYSARKMDIGAMFLISKYGDDIDTLNYGRNIFRSYLTRVADYNVTVGQGEQVLSVYFRMDFSKQVKNWLRISISPGIKIMSIEGKEQFQPFVLIGLNNGVLNYRNDWQ